MTVDHSKSIPVYGRDGLLGQVAPEPDAQTAGENAGGQYVQVVLAGGQVIEVPKDLLVAQQDGSFYLPMSREQFARIPTPSQGEGRMVIPVIVEEAQVGKKLVTRGRVRIQKQVNEREEVVDQPTIHEEVRVERIALNQMVSAPPPVRYEGQTMVIPVVEEVLVVEKRLRLKEEVRVTRVRTETRQPQTVRLRAESIDVERINPAEGADSSGTQTQ